MVRGGGLVIHGVRRLVADWRHAALGVLPEAHANLGMIRAETSPQHEWRLGLAHPVCETEARREVPGIPAHQRRWKICLCGCLELHADGLELRHDIRTGLL